VPALQHYRRYEAALAVAQRANNTRRVRAIHAKIANARRVPYPRILIFTTSSSVTRSSRRS
jgi:hypothetical protein